MSDKQLNVLRTGKQFVKVENWNYSDFAESLHIHSEYQLIYIEKGEGTLYLDKNIVSFRGGDVFLLGSNMPHRFVFSPKTESTKLDVEAISIFFPPKYASTMFFGIKEFFPILTLLKQSAFYVKVGKKRINDVHKAIVGMTNIRDDIERVLLLIEILNIIFSDYEKSPSRSIDNRTNSDKNINKVKRIYEFTLNNYKRVIYLSEVASLVNMTETAFCRFFMKVTGKTYMQFLLEIRVWMSCKLMVFTDLNLSEIATEVGFLSITNYIKQFKNVMNTTPSEYRSSLSQDMSAD